jgi:hypothetical protein
LIALLLKGILDRFGFWGMNPGASQVENLAAVRSLPNKLVQGFPATIPGSAAVGVKTIHPTLFDDLRQ